MNVLDNDTYALLSILSNYNNLHAALSVYLYAKLYAPEMLANGSEAELLGALRTFLLECEEGSSSKPFGNMIAQHSEL